MADRTKEVAHYVIARSIPEKLGATKLNKVMWFADLMSYQSNGRTITGQASYLKQKFGPVPNGIQNAVRSLQREGAIAARDVQTPVGIRHEYLWLKDPEVNIFSAGEIDILNQVIDLVCDGHSASSISELTHDALWAETPLYAQIDIGAACVEFAEMDEARLAWACEEIDRISQVH